MNNTKTISNEENSILRGLNPAQLEAATYHDGPLLIIAGAGTGKTTVLTKRIAYLIEQGIAKPSEILALTFTDKAAGEMEERIDSIVPGGCGDMWISTFNAFGDRLLRDFSLELGLPANFTVLSATEQAIFFRQNIYAFELKHYRPIANPLTHIGAMLSHFSRLKDELISPKNYLEFATKKLSEAKSEDEIISAEQTLELARTYEVYQTLMIESGNMDFNDQIFLAHKLLSENKRVLNECQNRFKFIMVDEFQDTNFAQNEIVKLLASQYKNITVVGDDDQSIYRFRGASISNIMQFMETYESAKQIVLNNNYRSTQEILDASYKLIQNNNPDRLEVKNSIDKRLISPKSGPKPELIFCDSSSCEADQVVETIKKLKSDMNLSYKDFAILVRANNHAEAFMQSLNVAGIPFAFSGVSGLFSLSEVKMLVAFLKCLAYTDDTLSFYQVATSEIYNISHDALTEYYTKAKRYNRTMIELLSYSKQTVFDFDDKPMNPIDNAEDLRKINELVKDIKKYTERKNDPCGEVLYDFLTEKGYLATLTDGTNVENQIKVYNIAKFFDRIAQFNHTSNDTSVLGFLQSLELILEIGDGPSISDIDKDLDAINILTAHASKGLEWPVVFVVNCVADRFPGSNRKEALPIPEELIRERLPEGDFHTQEERRLFYVAVTRAKDRLFVTAAEDYGGKRSKKISKFVYDLLDEVDTSKRKNKLEPIEKIKRFAKIEMPLAKLPNKFAGEILKLSRQHVEDYDSCPKKFYYSHVIKIPLLRNQSMMYGTAIHAALDHFFNRKLSGIVPTLEQLIADYKTAFKNNGFLSREQEQERYKQGIMTLTRFYREDQLEPTIPTKIEEVFEFSENKIKVNGRYDLVCGEGETAEIRDFKTSDVKDQKKADAKIKSSTQMQIYALAWYEKYGVIPKTTLVFIESGLKGEIVYKEKDLEKTKEMILSAAEGIRAQDLTAKPVQRQCQYCDYHNICKESEA